MMTPLFQEIKSLPTEQKNSKSSNIDSADTITILECINDEDALVAQAVRHELPFIAQAVDAMVERFKSGGRLFYVGAGTSGRLGIVDASECPPTFGTHPDMVQGIIAGGTPAIFKAQEGAEDNVENGKHIIAEHHVSGLDIVCGIAASGRTPYVRGALQEAKKRGAFTILVTTNSRNNILALGIEADVLICPEVGPEVVTGSTRMKSGTAQKMVLNMLTTASMIRLGKTFGNVMVDVQMTKQKLQERAKGILMDCTGVDYKTAGEYLAQADNHVKTALVMIIAGVSKQEAQERLAENQGFVRKAIAQSALS
ncbi:MAG: N-acetylmuramic acid 6-phosphate etherase [Ignavibacteria bacterium]|nr:N-acetylmuramic acid 6-phosphate etherase [Ignavibacteria bacterium]